MNTFPNYRYIVGDGTGVGVEPGPTVGDGFGSDGFIGVGLGDGDGFGSDGSIGVGVIFGSTTVGDGIGVAVGSIVGIGVAVGVGAPVKVSPFETVVAIIPEIKNKRVVITKAVFFNISSPINLTFKFRLRRTDQKVRTIEHNCHQSKTWL